MRLVEFDSHPMLVSESNYKNLKPLTIMAKEVLTQLIASRLNIDVDGVVDGLKDADMQGFDKKLFINAAKSLK